jgi:hypothetical protein
LTDGSGSKAQDAKPVPSSAQAPPPHPSITHPTTSSTTTDKGKAPLKRPLPDGPEEAGPSKRQKLVAASESGLSPAALEILKPPRKIKAPLYACLQCGHRPNSTKCTIECYHSFRTAHFVPALTKLQIRQTAPGPHATGLGVFVLPGHTIAEGDYLGEYLGQLLPADAPEAGTSDYAFDMPGRAVEHVRKVIVDAATYGNWTRFVNSSCEPNVQALAEQVGKVRVIVYRALRDIQADEQLLVTYGRGYFEETGILCCCEAKPEPHLPSMWRG